MNSRNSVCEGLVIIYIHSRIITDCGFDFPLLKYLSNYTRISIVDYEFKLLQHGYQLSPRCEVFHQKCKTTGKPTSKQRYLFNDI